MPLLTPTGALRWLRRHGQAGEAGQYLIHFNVLQQQCRDMDSSTLVWVDVPLVDELTGETLPIHVLYFGQTPGAGGH